MKKISKINRIFNLYLVNHIFIGTRFFAIKRYLLRNSGIKIGSETKVVGPLFFGTEIEIIIGDSCWIGKNATFDGNGMVVIGDRVDIGPHVVFCTGGHKIGDIKRRAGANIVNEINIGNGCWVGTCTTIINNTYIGESCVVAAGSLVKDSVDSNFLIAGVPAVIKRKL